MALPQCISKLWRMNSLRFVFSSVLFTEVLAFIEKYDEGGTRYKWNNMII